MADPILRCDGGGDHSSREGEAAVYHQPCPERPTVRWRPPAAVEGHWNYRCAKHAAQLDRNVCTVEPLAVVA